MKTGHVILGQGTVSSRSDILEKDMRVKRAGKSPTNRAVLRQEKKIAQTHGGLGRPSGRVPPAREARKKQLLAVRESDKTSRSTAPG